jgi:hypothetical protein
MRFDGAGHRAAKQCTRPHREGTRVAVVDGIGVATETTEPKGWAMKQSSMILSIVLAAALLPASVRADDSTTPSRSSRTAGDRYDDGRYDNGRYNDRRSGGYVDSRVVRDLAHDLEGLTRAAHREAARGDNGYRDRYRDRNGREHRALADLDRLRDRARQFRREVDRSSRDRRRSEREFDALYGAYVDAQDGLRATRPSRQLRDLFRRVDHTMDELVDYYGGESRYAHWRNGRRSDDRYRDGDRDWDRDRHRSTDSGYDDDRYDRDDDDGDDDDDDDDRDRDAHRRTGDDDDR